MGRRIDGGLAGKSSLSECFECTSVPTNLCSPLSDTTILTVLATRTRRSRPEHIRTVLGYASLVGAIALIFGDIAVGLQLYGPLTALAVCSALEGPKSAA